jgi:hypothetical protein
MLELPSTPTALAPQPRGEYAGTSFHQRSKPYRRNEEGEGLLTPLRGKSLPKFIFALDSFAKIIWNLRPGFKIAKLPNIKKIAFGSSQMYILFERNP